MLLTTINNTEEAKERGYRYIIYSGSCMYHFFSSNSEKAYKRIIKKLGFKTEKSREEEISDNFSMKWLEGEITNISFTKKEQLPKKAKAIKALSNGSIVKCYYLRQGKELLFFRPNPNCKEIYKPLSIKKHIKHVLKYGVL